MSFFENQIIAERQRKKAAAELGISYESYVARFIKLKGTYQ